MRKLSIMRLSFSPPSTAGYTIAAALVLDGLSIITDSDSAGLLVYCYTRPYLCECSAGRPAAVAALE